MASVGNAETFKRYKESVFHHVHLTTTLKELKMMQESETCANLVRGCVANVTVGSRTTALHAILVLISLMALAKRPVALDSI